MRERLAVFQRRRGAHLIAWFQGFRMRDPAGRKLRGPVLVANAQGNFSYQDHLTSGINSLDFQVVDPYGHQLLRAFPLLWLGFGQYENAHPTRT